MIAFVALALLLPLTACQHQPLHIVAVHDDPSRFVRIEVDPSIGGGHSHPATITTDEMATVLSGMMIEEPPRVMTALSLQTGDAEPRRHPAFNETEILFWAPLFSEGLRSANAEQVVTFYYTNQKTTLIDKVTFGGMLVTSGGMFIDGDELHLILSNYRSPTNDAPDPGVGTTLDGRSTPLRSLSPQRTKIYFEPATAIAPSQAGILSRIFSPDRREIVVQYKSLTSTISDKGHTPQ